MDKINEYTSEYVYYGDHGIYTPTEAEREMLVDFAHGLLAELSENMQVRATALQYAASIGHGNVTDLIASARQIEAYINHTVVS